MAKKTKARPRAYVDTSALIAFLDKSDTQGPRTSKSLVLAADPSRLASLPAPVLRSHPSRMELRIVPVGAEEHAGGVRVLRRFSDQDLTLADAVGLHVMKALGIHACWSTDFHLGLTGIPLVVDEH